VRRAFLDLLGQRVAVARRAAQEDVVDEHVLALQADLAEKLLEQLPRGAYEWKALKVLLGPWRLPHEHDVGVRVAGSEDELRTGLLQRAVMVVSEPVVELDQLRPPLLRAGFRHLAGRLSL
jgi:hypothetical protein